MLPEFFTLRNWTRFCLYLNNRQSHGQMDATGGFSASSWSKNTPPRRSDCRLLMLYKVVKELWAEFFALRLWRCSGQPCNNQQNYGQMDVTAGFSGSERSRNNLGRNSNCSGRMFYSRENLWIRRPIGLDQNTLPPMAPVFLYISSKLPREILEQLCVYCKNLLGLCVRKCGNRGAVVVVVQTQAPIGHENLQLVQLQPPQLHAL